MDMNTWIDLDYVINKIYIEKKKTRKIGGDQILPFGGDLAAAPWLVWFCNSYVSWFKPIVLGFIYKQKAIKKLQ